MKAKTGLYLAGGIVTLSLIAVDQFTKYLAKTILAGTSGISMIPGVFELYYLENTGAAFGMLDNRQIFFAAVAFMISAFAVYVYIRTPWEPRDRTFYYPLRLVCVLLTAGALGNMIDRMTRGYVVDFLYFSLIDFPVFNLADCYVCVGAGLALIFLLTKYRSEEFAFLKIRKEG